MPWTLPLVRSSGPVTLATTLPARDDHPREALARRPRGQVAGPWEADGTYRFDRTKARDEVFSIDTPAAHGQRVPPPGPRLQLHPHRPRRPLPAHARQGGLLPDGVGRQRPQRRAPRPAHDGHDRRPHPPLRPRLPPAGEVRPQGPARRREPAQLRRAVRSGRARARGGVPRPVGDRRPVGRLGPHLHARSARRPRASPSARVPAPGPA